MFTYIIAAVAVIAITTFIIAMRRLTNDTPFNPVVLNPHQPVKTEPAVKAPITTPVIKFNSNVFERAELLGSLLRTPEPAVVARVDLIGLNPTTTLVRVVLNAVNLELPLRYLEYVTSPDTLSRPVPTPNGVISGSLSNYTAFINACEGLLVNDVHYFEAHEVIVPTDPEIMDIVLGKDEDGIGTPVCYLDAFGQERPYNRIGFTVFEPPFITTHISLYPNGSEDRRQLYYAAYQSEVDYLSINTVVELAEPRSIHCFFCVGIDFTAELAIPYNVPYTESTV